MVMSIVNNSLLNVSYVTFSEYVLGVLCFKLRYWSAFDTHRCFIIATSWHNRLHTHKGLVISCFTEKFVRNYF